MCLYDIYIYIYILSLKKKTKTGYFRIINLFPSCFAFLMLTKNTKKNITGLLQILWINKTE